MTAIIIIILLSGLCLLGVYADVITKHLERFEIYLDKKLNKKTKVDINIDVELEETNIPTNTWVNQRVGNNKTKDITVNDVNSNPRTRAKQKKRRRD